MIKKKVFTSYGYYNDKHHKNLLLVWNINFASVSRCDDIALSKNSCLRYLE